MMMWKATGSVNGAFHLAEWAHDSRDTLPRVSLSFLWDEADAVLTEALMAG